MNDATRRDFRWVLVVDYRIESTRMRVDVVDVVRDGGHGENASMVFRAEPSE